MGITIFWSLKMEHSRESDEQKYHKESPRAPWLYSGMKMLAKRNRQFMVGFGLWINMPLLEVVRLFKRVSEGLAATLVHRGGATSCYQRKKPKTRLSWISTHKRYYICEEGLTSVVGRNLFVLIDYYGWKFPINKGGLQWHVQYNECHTVGPAI